MGSICNGGLILNFSSSMITGVSGMYTIFVVLSGSSAVKAARGSRQNSLLSSCNGKESLAASVMTSEVDIGRRPAVAEVAGGHVEMLLWPRGEADITLREGSRVEVGVAKDVGGVAEVGVECLSSSRRQ